MLFRQIFDSGSATYTYLLAARHGAVSLIIDPVLEKVEQYLRLIDELDLKLGKAIDTHMHADHVSGIGAPRDATRCVTVMGQKNPTDVVSMRVRDGDWVEAGDLRLRAFHTPGHTGESYSFVMDDRVFTGDALFIRGTGRTDLQAGNSHDAYHSIFGKLLTLPDDTLIFPGHDYNGMTVSTVAEERAFNPRLQVSSPEEYAKIMDNLALPSLKMMDVAVPSNSAMGLSQEKGVKEGWGLSAGKEIAESDGGGALLVDLREGNERLHDANIAGSVHAPYAALDQYCCPGGLLQFESAAGGKRLIFFCSYGERSAMAVKAAKEAGLDNVASVVGGIKAWMEAGGPVIYDKGANQDGGGSEASS